MRLTLLLRLSLALDTNKSDNLRSEHPMQHFLLVCFLAPTLVKQSHFHGKQSDKAQLHQDRNSDKHGVGQHIVGDKRATHDVCCKSPDRKHSRRDSVSRYNQEARVELFLVLCRCREHCERDKHRQVVDYDCDARQKYECSPKRVNWYVLAVHNQVGLVHIDRYGGCKQHWCDNQDGPKVRRILWEHMAQHCSTAMPGVEHVSILGHLCEGVEETIHDQKADCVKMECDLCIQRTRNLQNRERTSHQQE
ncbi:hypothetical protein BJ741DRAFT_636318 [Chytriomyces cf. hyalinus JEL632]|nr:hypothetical protein BJ741DRAFT_636318 [Chytriomyces cf. hyalinus JEL632]